MFFVSLALFVQTTLAVKVYDLGEDSSVQLPVGKSIEILKEADITGMQTWTVKDPKIVRLQFQALPPRADPKADNFTLVNRSAIRVTCTRDCKIGETFEVVLELKSLRTNQLIRTFTLTVTVVPANTEL